MLFEGRYPLCRDSTGGASGLASAAIDTSGFVDLALVAILRNGFDRTRRHASATTDADSFINLMGHFELLLCMDEKKKREPGFFTLLVCKKYSGFRHKTQVAFACVNEAKEMPLCRSVPVPFFSGQSKCHLRKYRLRLSRRRRFLCRVTAFVHVPVSSECGANPTFESARFFLFRMGIGMRGRVEHFAESNQTLMVRIRRRRVCVPREGNRL